MDGVKCAVLNVGGWFDAEDPMGPLRTYRAVEQKNPGTPNMLVMGPWSHGGWGRGPGEKLGNLDFAVKTGEVFRDQMQFPFFMKYLKDKAVDLPEAWMYLTGANEWRRHAEWPPKNVTPTTLYFGASGALSMSAPAAGGYDEYVSDPNHPVPYVGYIAGGMTGDYMTEDQRFASQRPDVLVYQSEPLEEDMIVAGPFTVHLNVSTTGTDSDFVVKLVDVYPGDYPSPPPPEGQRPPSNAIKMGGYQQLVRGEPFRGKYRNSFEKPDPFAPGQQAEDRVPICPTSITHSAGGTASWCRSRVRGSRWWTGTRRSSWRSRKPRPRTSRRRPNASTGRDRRSPCSWKASSGDSHCRPHRSNGGTEEQRVGSGEHWRRWPGRGDSRCGPHRSDGGTEEQRVGSGEHRRRGPGRGDSRCGPHRSNGGTEEQRVGSGSSPAAVAGSWRQPLWASQE